MYICDVCTTKLLVVWQTWDQRKSVTAVEPKAWQGPGDGNGRKKTTAWTQYIDDH